MIQKYPLSIRADGNATIGLGHIHRTLALAGYLKYFFDITFYVINPDLTVSKLITANGFSLCTLDGSVEDAASFMEIIPEKSIVILDGYEFKTAYQHTVKASGHPLVAIDDLNQWENVADVVINHAFPGPKENYKLANNARFYGGLKYCIIKQEILNTKPEEIKTIMDGVLVCIGGTDPGKYSERIVKELLEHSTKKITLITYPLNINFAALKILSDSNPLRFHLLHSLDTFQLIKLIKEHQIAVLQPSNIALEAAALGIYIFLLQTADNQKFVLETLVKDQCATALDPTKIAMQIESVTLTDVNQQLKRQHNFIDRKSPARILDIINELLLAVRKTEPSDAVTIYKWNTDAVTRQNSYNQSEIKYEDHLRWYSAKINDKDCCFLIFDYNSIPAGCVRIDIKEKENVIGITVAPEMRGRKMSSLFLNTASEYFFKHYPHTEITAYIKINNVASIKSFQNAGYIILDSNEYFGEESYKLIKRKDEYI